MNPSIRIETAYMWSKGLTEGIVVESEGIALDSSNFKHGYYIGEIIDSMETGHLWSRMQYRKTPINETSIVLRTLALDQLTVQIGNQLYELESIIEQKRLSASRVCELLSQIGASRHENAQDILLYDQKGRYLIYWFELMADGTSDRIDKVEIFYEKFSWLNYLPQIYSEQSDFLERYLAVFQTVHENLEAIIDKMAEVYMPERTTVDFLEVLNRWLPVDGFEYWNEQQRRHLLSNYQHYNRMRGTRKGIEAYVELFTGEVPYIVEYMAYEGLQDSNYHRQLYDRIYTNHPFGFTLLLQAEAVKDRKQLLALKTILNQIVPAQVSFKIARLNPYMVLDDYVYLGVNTYICSQSEMKLDEASMLSMSVIGDENERG